MYWSAIAILLVFAALAAAMYSRRLPALVALPVMGIAIAAFGGLGPGDILLNVVENGAFRLHEAYVAAMFGAILSEVTSRAGVVNLVVRTAAELGGDRPFLVGLGLTVVSVLLFTTLAGLGAVIMVGTMVFPILLAVGIRPITAASLFLMALSTGGVLNIANWQFFMEAFQLSQQTLLFFALPLLGVSFVISIAFLAIQLRQGARKLWAEKFANAAPPVQGPPWYCVLTPLIPVCLIVFFGVRNLLVGSSIAYRLPLDLFPFWVRNVLVWLLAPSAVYEFPLISAMAIGIAYGILAARRPEKGRVQLLSASVIEGIRQAAPAVAVMLGIGMVVQAATDPFVSSRLGPILSRLAVDKPFVYVLAFAILAPLALYRGPLNVWGLGIGVAALLMGVGAAPPAALMGALFSVGQIQGICDPTNTHNVWVANYTGVDVQEILRRTFPYAWLMALAGLVLSAIRFL